VLESVPRRVQALAGKKVIGASAGGNHTAVWTEEGDHAGISGSSGDLAIERSSLTEEGDHAGELNTFGIGNSGMLGHGGYQNESVPRLVQALVGKKVVGAAASEGHTSVWTVWLRLWQDRGRGVGTEVEAEVPNPGGGGRSTGGESDQDGQKPDTDGGRTPRIEDRRYKRNRRADTEEHGQAAKAAEAAEAEPRRKRKAQAEPEQAQDEENTGHVQEQATNRKQEGRTEGGGRVNNGPATRHSTRFASRP